MKVLDVNQLQLFSLHLKVFPVHYVQKDKEKLEYSIVQSIIIFRSENFILCLITLGDVNTIFRGDIFGTIPNPGLINQKHCRP